MSRKARSSILTAGDLRAYCLSLTEAEETFPFGDEVAVFKVAGKVFALVGLTDVPMRVSLKCDPEEAIALREQYAAIRPGYHLNKRHWNTVTLDGTVRGDELRALVDESWRLVVAGMARATRLRLGVS